MAEPEQRDRPRDENWERDLVNRLAFASLNEQRRNRRWGIFFKALVFVYLFVLLLVALPTGEFTQAGLTGEHTAIVEVNGLISDGSEANAEDIIDGLRDAFEAKNVKGVILRINSPGGSPVQSAYVYDEVRRLREEHPAIPVHAVIVDMGASGAYYIAAAADNIYANGSSIVGSIGVLMNGFGFVDTLDKLGVERRLLTAGENKALLDPFSPVEDGAAEHMQQMLDAIHVEFIDAVKRGRDERLVDRPEVFSGLMWTGRRAQELGLIDDLADVGYVAREVIGAEETINYTVRPDLLSRFADRIGAAMATQFGTHLGANEPLPGLR